MMVSEEFKIGDLVWAKMKGYPLWPAKIESPPSDIKAPKNKKSYYVYFFGSKNFAWISDDKIIAHSESLMEQNSKKKLVNYQSAIDAFTDYIKTHKKEEVISPTSKKGKLANDSVESKKKVVKKLFHSLTKHKKTHPSFHKKIYRKRLHEVDTGVGTSGCSYPKSQRLETHQFPRVGSVPPRIINSEMDGSSWNGSRPPFEHYASENIGRPSYLLERKHVLQSSKKFGFIGLGHIGKGIVKILLDSGHDVMVWNKTSYKCDPFIAGGAKRAVSVAELIVDCDITFSCVTDPEASKSLIFGDRGVLKGLELSKIKGMTDKGYVEMTSIDPDTSQEIAEMIMNHCRYLEAPVCGTSVDAQEGTLLILAAGDRTLFIDCETCFHAIGKHAFYINCHVGSGSRMGLILSMVSGTVCAAVAEAMILVERLNLQKEDFLEILKVGPLQCRKIIEKAGKMGSRDFLKPVTPLKHVQKDLNLSLLMGDDYSQPMPVTAAANEVYKHARMLKYSECDVSAVVQGVRF